MDPKDFFDHTLLKPDTDASGITKLCSEAKEHRLKAVCVPRDFVAQAKTELIGSSVLVATVIGFPEGNHPTATKVEETQDAVRNGADELDMVQNYSKIKEKSYQTVFEDIKAVVGAAQGRCVKVILETSELTTEEIISSSAIAMAAGADFVKTSTGFSSSGAKKEDIAVMRSVVGPKKGVKASGGIRDAATFLEMVEAGANRIGASASLSIIEELNQR